MRVAVVNWSNRNVGGAEKYLSVVIPELARLGHSLAFWHEVAEPVGREQIDLPSGTPRWCVSEMGTERALSALNDWQPDLIYAHGLQDPGLEAETIRLAPSIFLAHAYYGTCISGYKTFKNPAIEPCARRFGWQCLLHYYPQRCGGLSPLTMWNDFRLQSKRLKLLRSYDAVITLSEHMKSEYLKHEIVAEHAYGISSGELRTSKYFSDNARPAGNNTSPRREVCPSPRPEEHQKTDCWRLLFLGRMDFLKGGHLLLEALPRIYASLNRPLHVTFAGDGPERQRWEEQAARVEAQHPEIRIEFKGWVSGAQLDALLSDCDLLVFPSLWPEPFGFVGPEAGAHGVPVIAFASGGTLDWLIDGVNGYLAAGNPPTAEGLARVAVKCLRDPRIRLNLSRGAREVARSFTLENHLTALLSVFDRVAKLSS